MIQPDLGYLTQFDIHRKNKYVISCLSLIESFPWVLKLTFCLLTGDCKFLKLR